MKSAIKSIKKIFDDSKRDKIRYSEIEHIENHHEALKEMGKNHLVYVYFVGYKIYIEKNIGW